VNRRMSIAFQIVVLALVYSIPFMIKGYDLYMDEFHANPGYNPFVGSPQYMGAFYWFSIDTGIPQTLIVVNFQTSRDDFNESYCLTSDEWDSHFSCGEYWLIERVYPGPDIYECVRITLYWFVPRFVVITDNYGITYWDFEGLELALVLENVWTSTHHYECELYNLTLEVSAHGWI